VNKPKRTRPGTKKPEEILESRLAIRVPEKFKAILIEESRAEKKSLSNHLFNLVNAGREVTRESGPANVEGANETETRAGKMNFSKLMGRLDDILRQPGKDETRELLGSKIISFF
jgi:hypothetical protein